MEMLDLNEMLNQLAKVSNIHWHGHVLRRREDGPVFEGIGL